MKDEIWQQRQFILSSFRRLKISINTDAYRFADKLIKEKWDSSSMDLNQIDYYIREEFSRFIQGT